MSKFTLTKKRIEVVYRAYSKGAHCFLTSESIFRLVRTSKTIRFIINKENEGICNANPASKIRIPVSIMEEFVERYNDAPATCTRSVTTSLETKIMPILSGLRKVY